MATQHAQGGVARPLALVTGASSGIGAVYTARLAHAGYDVMAVAQRHAIVAASDAQTAHGCLLYDGRTGTIPTWSPPTAPFGGTW